MLFCLVVRPYPLGYDRAATLLEELGDPVDALVDCLAPETILTDKNTQEIPPDIQRTCHEMGR